MRMYRCLLIEDDSLAIDMMTDYIGRRDELLMVGIVQERCEILGALNLTKPDIVFLDLVIPSGGPSGFHFGLFPTSLAVVVVSATSTDCFTEQLPPIVTYQLLKPISFNDFEACIDRIIQHLQHPG